MQIRWSRRRSLSVPPAAAAAPERPRGMEMLEERMLMAAGPRVVDVFADNRGQVALRVDQKLDAASVTNKSAQIIVDGEKQKARISYAPRTRQITITANLKADTAYTIRLVSKKIRDTRGNRLDGEFRGANKSSGNGKAGGDFVATTKVAGSKIARFETIYGNMDVKLFDKQTPLTVRNFLRYANRKLWDNTFFHRSAKDFVVQGGGFRFDAKKNTVDQVKQFAAVKNEPFPGNPGNVRGTIAMAKLGGDPNSATNQWFFNLGDNRANLDNQNGGFTAFGKITSKAGLKVMDKIGSRERVNVGGAFGELPVRNLQAVTERQRVEPRKDLIIVKRVAIKMDLA